MANSPRDMEAATFDVLFKDWYRRTPGFLIEGSDKYNDLQLAKQEANLAVYERL